MFNEDCIARPNLGENENYVSAQLSDLEYAIRTLKGETDVQAGYGVDFKNEVFEMFPYCWDDCECIGSLDGLNHEDDCPHSRPNFACGDVVVIWYKYIGRGMEVDEGGIDRKQWRDIFAKCQASLDPKPKEV